MPFVTESRVAERSHATLANGGRPWLAPLPHILAAGAAALVLGIAPAIAGLLLATLVSFVVYLPLTVIALNEGSALADDADAPALSPVIRFALLTLWAATVWAAAAVAATV
jgi:hypothetical protein